MIGEIVTILKNDLAIGNTVGTDNIFPIQRKQGSGLPAITVDLIDVKTSETKDKSSGLDFVTIQVATYADNPRESFVISGYVRDELDKYVGVVNGEDVDIRFDDLETGMSSEDETFITIAEFVVTVKRTAQGAHN